MNDDAKPQTEATPAPAAPQAPARNTSHETVAALRQIRDAVHQNNQLLGFAIVLLQRIGLILALGFWGAIGYGIYRALH